MKNTKKTKRPFHNGGNKSKNSCDNYNPKDKKASVDAKASSEEKMKWTENPADLYYPNPLIGEAYSNFPYNYPVGIPFKPGADMGLTGNVEYNVPSMMVIYANPVYGSFGSAASAVNVAARAAFAFVRKHNAGSAPYESSDLMSYYMAMDQIYAKMHEVKRLIMASASYFYGNRTLPKVIFDAYSSTMLEEAQKNHSAHVGFYNIIVDKINRQFAVPRTLKIFERRSLVYGPVYADSTSMKGQFYMFQSSGWFKWNGEMSGGSSLIWDPETSDVNTITEFLELINNEVDRLMGIQDIAIMSGDTIKAYGPENCYALTPVTFDDVLVPVYDESILGQIENATIMGSTSGYWTTQINDITQSDNLLSGGVTVAASGSNIEGDKLYERFSVHQILNSRLDNPTWENNLENTRLKAAALSYDAINNIMQISCGSEICSGARIYLYGDNDRDVRVGNTLVLVNDGQGFDCIYQMATMSNFDWHPISLVYLSPNTGSNMCNFLGILGDVHTATVISPGNIQGTHDCAMLALFNSDMLTVG